MDNWLNLGVSGGTRQKEWSGKLFHNLKPCTDALKSVFDIDAFKNFEQSDIDFAVLMFHRRHVYEHNGGEVDEKYIRNSGDTSVRLKQVIRESSYTANRIVNLVLKIAQNISEGFHAIFPAEEMPIRFQQSLKSTKNKTACEHDMKKIGIKTLLNGF